MASAISRRRHCLAADVKADAERIGRLAGGDQQRADLARVGAELGGEAELGVLRADADADEQIEIGRRNAVARRRANDLSSSSTVSRLNVFDAVIEIGLGDRFLGLHRVHEADDCLGQRLVDQADLADRGDVVMGDARVPQDAQQVRRRVRLDRVERAARELLDEEAGRAARGMWAQQRDRLDRTLLGDIGSPRLPVGAAASPSAR